MKFYAKKIDECRQGVIKWGQIPESTNSAVEEPQSSQSTSRRRAWAAGEGVREQHELLGHSHTSD